MKQIYPVRTAEFERVNRIAIWQVQAAGYIAAITVL